MSDARPRRAARRVSGSGSRPRGPATLPAAVAGVVVGSGRRAWPRAPRSVPTPPLGCVLVALLLQVLANFANDLSDFRRGADTPDRAGPVRVAAAGLVTERQLEAGDRR